MQDRGFIWRELTGHATHTMGFCDRSTDDNQQQIENTKIKTEITSFWGTRDCACPRHASTGPLLL